MYQILFKNHAIIYFRPLLFIPIFRLSLAEAINLNELSQAYGIFFTP
jgi:hypothetical protein